MANDYVITIARQYGCGGRVIGKKIAEKLGIPYYDNELIKMAAKINGVGEEYYKDIDEKARGKFSSIFAYGTPNGGYFMPMYSDLLINDQLFYTQANIIKDIAMNPCVIVGRCADYILNDKPNLVKIYLHANMDTRRSRIRERYGVEDKDLEKIITKADKRRATYYNTYSDQAWGDSRIYDLCIDTSRLAIDQVVDIVYQYVDMLDKNSVK